MGSLGRTLGNKHHVGYYLLRRWKEEGGLQDGKEGGFWIYWDEDGNITEIKTYKDGVLVQ